MCQNSIYLNGETMKIVYFLKNGVATAEDKDRAESFKLKGNKCKFSNGSAPYGFEDSCDAVYLSHDFPHIEEWAVSKGIKVMKPEPVVDEPIQEVKTNAETLSDTEWQEEKTEEEVKPRRGRRKAVDSESDSE